MMVLVYCLGYTILFYFIGALLFFLYQLWDLRKISYDPILVIVAAVFSLVWPYFIFNPKEW